MMAQKDRGNRGHYNRKKSARLMAQASLSFEMIGKLHKKRHFIVAA